jgi:5-methylcytosine-specific restriction endonuclease McrA
VDDDGMVVLRGRLTPEVGAVVQRALEAAADRLFRETVTAPDGGQLSEEVTPGQRRAEALGLLAEVALAADLDAGTAGDRYQVVLHVEATEQAVVTPEDARATGTSVPSAPEHLAFGGALEVGNGAFRVSAETSQRLSCDASLVRMDHDRDGTVLDVGPKTRTIPPAIRRALRARDTRCQFPGCTARRCDAHHLVHWAEGDATRLDNLVLLCRRHHRAVHEGGFTLTRHDDAVIVRQPNGMVLHPALRVSWHEGPRHGDNVTARVPEHPLDATTRRLAAANITIGPRTLVPWDGTPFNVVYAIDVLYRPLSRQVGKDLPV